MQTLKALVIGMGLLIVGGMVLLGWGLYQKSNNPDFKLFKSAEPPAEAPAASPPLSGGQTSPAAAPFGETLVDLPAGSEVLATDVADGRLVAHVALADGSRLVVIVDLARGTELGRVALRPAR